MCDTRCLFDLKRNISQSISEIQIANDYKTACAIWEGSYRKLSKLYKAKIINQNTYRLFCDMLDEAIVD